MGLASAVAHVTGVASNIREGTNPEYTIAMFREIMPAFTADILPDAVLQHYIDMANGVVLEARWHSLWKEGMRLYIAHFATLYLGVPEAGASRQKIVNAGKVQGAMTSKTVGPVSVGYDNGQDATSDLTGWGAWKLTTYGTQFATLARMVGKGGMYVR